MNLTFLGAARNVTGSSYYLEVNGKRLLVDCGLYQERDLQTRNWQPFPVDPASLDCVLLTHAHLDHCGLLPKLVRSGFRGEVYCTDPTADMAEIILVDSARVMEEDAQQKRQRHEREGRQAPYPEAPLYTENDAVNSLHLFSPVEYGEPVELADGLTATFLDAGHVLGSAMILFTASDDEGEKTVLFTGDMGRRDRPLLRNPATIAHADYVVMESTYGDRSHDSHEAIDDQLAGMVQSALSAGGNLVVPSFALERAQEVLYYMNRLLIKKRIPPLPIFLDSPMAVSITSVFSRHPEFFDKDLIDLMAQGLSPFDFPGLMTIRSSQESKSLNAIRGTAMIVSGSGMCTGGRIKHHLVHNISRPESTIMFVGYQAAGTLGREIVDGAERVRILGEYYPVRAKVAQVHGFSAHGDRNDLLAWLESMQDEPMHIFLTHGEPESAIAFQTFLHERTGINVSVPQYGERVSLD